MAAARGGPLPEPPPPAGNTIANAAHGALNTRIAVAATSNRLTDSNTSVLLIR